MCAALSHQTVSGNGRRHLLQHDKLTAMSWCSNSTAFSGLYRSSRRRSVWLSLHQSRWLLRLVRTNSLGYLYHSHWLTGPFLYCRRDVPQGQYVLSVQNRQYGFPRVGAGSYVCGICHTWLKLSHHYRLPYRYRRKLALGKHKIQ